MTTLIIEGGHLITPLEERFASLWIDGSVIQAISNEMPQDRGHLTVIDASGCYVTPGLLDIQVNGNASCDFWDIPAAAALAAICEDLSKNGVTSFLPTLITASIEHLQKTVQALADNGVSPRQAALDYKLWDSRPVNPARLLGVHLEGPFLSPERPGVHPAEHIHAFTKAAVDELITPAVKLMTVAPERDPSGDAIAHLRRKNVTLSLGHSNADFVQANEAFQRGIKLVTHIFNAMPALHHRKIGACGAALLAEDVTCCLIPDGLHVDPAMVDLLLRIKSPARTLLVTDLARIGTSQGGLVGSSLILDQGVRNLVSWNIASFREAIRMASYNPAAALGFETTLGHLHPGKHADIVIWDKQSLEIKHVVLAGRLIK